VELQILNREYVRSVLESYVKWFDQNLGEDFLCTTRDGSLVDRARFLKQTALPIGLSNFELHDMTVRAMGDFALIHAWTTYTQPDGKSGASRYTDAWARRHGRWVAVSAHITPVR
jgi:ketosteroid isomerase-like protein